MLLQWDAETSFMELKIRGDYNVLAFGLFVHKAFSSGAEESLQLDTGVRTIVAQPTKQTSSLDCSSVILLHPQLSLTGTRLNSLLRLY